MSEPGWAGDCGFVWGLNAGVLDDDSAVLPESVEAQVTRTLDNLEGILKAEHLAWSNVVALRLNLTQFERFERRVLRTLDRYFAAVRHAPTPSLVGVQHLPRDALVGADAILARD